MGEPRRRAALGAAAIAAALLASAAAAGGSRAARAGDGPAWVDVRAFGARGDGTTDDTEAFRRAAATGKALRVPRPPAFYRLTGKVRVHGSVVGDGLPTIRMDGADGREERAIFELRDYRGPGAVFRGLHLDGGWDGAGTAGEWSHLIVVKGSRNVTIEANVLERPYGDCVLLGGEGVPSPSEDVTIRDNRMEGPRRCHVAIISARGVTIAGNTFRRTSAYVAAIDLEPNPGTPDAVHDVEIARNTFDVRGIAIQLYTLPTNLPSGGVAIRENAARADRFLVKPAGTGRWSGIAVTGNTYRGGRGEGGGQSFLEVLDASDVTIARNEITLERLAGGDTLRGVRPLTFRENVWTAPHGYPVTVADCSGARIDGNRLAGASLNVYR